MASVFRAFLEKLSGSTGTFIGESGDLFFDPDAATPTIKISDGSTPGGKDISSASVEIPTEIIDGDSKVKVSDPGTGATISFELDNQTQWTFSPHMLPQVDNTIDIGSAGKKIRDVFISSGSLWVGDNSKIETSGGKMKFKDRKKSDTHTPSVIAAADPAGTWELAQEQIGALHAGGIPADEAEAITYGHEVNNSSDITLAGWLWYARNYVAGLSDATVGTIWPPEKVANGDDHPDYEKDDYDIIDTVGDRGVIPPQTNPSAKVDVDLFVTKSAIITNPTGGSPKQFDFISPFIEEGASFEATCYVLNPNSEPIPTFTIMGAAAGTQQISGTPNLTASLNTYKISAIRAGELWHMSIRCYPHL